jgi:hypothetical protein
MCKQWSVQGCIKAKLHFLTITQPPVYAGPRTSLCPAGRPATPRAAAAAAAPLRPSARGAQPRSGSLQGPPRAAGAVAAAAAANCK